APERRDDAAARTFEFRRVVRNVCPERRDPLRDLRPTIARISFQSHRLQLETRAFDDRNLYLELPLERRCPHPGPSHVDGSEAALPVVAAQLVEIGREVLRNVTARPRPGDEARPRARRPPAVAHPVEQ